MDTKIIDQIVNEIKSLNTGDEFTIRNYLLKYNINDEGNQMFEYYRAIITKIHDIVDLPEEYIGAKVGLPYNIPLIRN